MEFLYEYGLFLAKAVTLVVAILVVLGMLAAMRSKGKTTDGEIEIRDLSEDYERRQKHFEEQLVPSKLLRKQRKEQAKADKHKAKKDSEKRKRTLFVIDFKGSMDAHEVGALRDEISAVLTVADANEDEVLLRLESGGGVVHGYGLGASQLERLRHAGIPLTVAIDKVAASGGYLMVVVGQRILAAPFAFIGSIGVIAQLPNFHRLLKRNDVDFEQHTAGQYKRTLTMFGENSEEGREKFREELALIHAQFKEHVGRLRPQLDVDAVATGEVWSGVEAHRRGLVDDLLTSDDLVTARCADQEWQVVAVRRKVAQPLAKRLARQGAELTRRLVQRALAA